MISLCNQSFVWFTFLSFVPAALCVRVCVRAMNDRPFRRTDTLFVIFVQIECAFLYTEQIENCETMICFVHATDAGDWSVALKSNARWRKCPPFSLQLNFHTNPAY